MKYQLQYTASTVNIGLKLCERGRFDFAIVLYCIAGSRHVWRENSIQHRIVRGCAMSVPLSYLYWHRIPSFWILRALSKVLPRHVQQRRLRQGQGHGHGRSKWLLTVHVLYAQNMTYLHTCTCYSMLAAGDRNMHLIFC